MTTEREKDLERRLELAQRARRQLADQVAHLSEWLADARRRTAWLKSELQKRDAKPTE